MENLIKQSFEITNGLQVYYPQYNHLQTLTIEDDMSKQIWCQNNGVIAFIYQGHYYAIPASQEVRDTLRANNIPESSCYVPFSNWDICATESRKAEWVQKFKKKTSEID